MNPPRYDWADLIMKYLRQEISADELKELERQKATSTLKQEQFDHFTDKKLFLEDLREQYHIDTKAGWAKLVAATPFLQKKEGILKKYYWNFVRFLKNCRLYISEWLKGPC
jgi:hypothetical protein